MVTIYFLDNRRLTFSSAAAADRFLRAHGLTNTFERIGSDFFQTN